MSLFGSIGMAGNTLRANQIALQVIGQNIANANTPGFIREETVLMPAATQRIGDLLLGLGVRVDAVIQRIDQFLEERLRGAVSEQVQAETEESTYMQLEGVIGELGETDLSTLMNNFFSSIAEILNQPESISVRNMAVLQGIALTGHVNRMAARVTNVRSDLNDRIVNMAGDINRLIEQIRVLNLRITSAEGGDISASDAVGLRDQRQQAMEDLAKLIDIRVKEQPSGGVAIYAGGDFLVFEAISHEVEVAFENDRGLLAAEIHLAGVDVPLSPASGELRGLLTARDEILGGFLDRLDQFAGTFAFEFNKIYSGGQGLNGFQELTSEFAVDAADVALDNAGLVFTPVNGSFQVLVRNEASGMTQTTDVVVDLNGVGEELTLEGLAAALDAIDGISASSSPVGKLTIAGESSDQEFAFADDTSGLLAALGLNTFFSGSTAHDLGVSEALREDPAKFAASRGGIGADTENAVQLAVFLDRPIDSQNGASLSVLYDRLTGETAQASSIAQAVADAARTFEGTLRAQKLATSGVNLDEEAVKMISFQRSYQASARYIATLNELLDIMVNL